MKILKIIMLILATLFFVILVSSYTADNYDSIQSTLNSNYVADNYNSIQSVFGSDEGVVDTNFTIWDGVGWVDAWSSGEYIEFRCKPTQTDCEPTNQNAGSSQCIYRVCNNGTAEGTAIYIHVNQTFTNIDLKCDDDYTPTGAIVLTTNNQTIHGTITSGGCVDICCWADYNNPTSGGYFDVYAYVI